MTTYLFKALSVVALFRLASRTLNTWIARRREAKAAYKVLCREDLRSRLPRHGLLAEDFRAHQERAARGRSPITFHDRRR